MDFTIVSAQKADAPVLADLIAKAYQTVADQFKLTRDNCPKHPSNCTQEWITQDLQHNKNYYMAQTPKGPVGCMALEQPDSATVWLERLSVLPPFRHQGLGRALVDYGIQKARLTGASTLGVGIIHEQTILRQWYEAQGFTLTHTQTYDHLPFTVGFMELHI